MNKNPEDHNPSDGDESQNQGKRPDGPVDPLGAMFQQMFGGTGAQSPGSNIPGMPDPQMLQMVFSQIQALMSGGGDGAVNWDLAKTMARNTVAAAGPDPSPTDGEQRTYDGAVQLAEHWLDQVTSLPAGTAGTRVWSRAQWIEETLPVWKQLVEPVADRITSAMGEAVGGAVGELNMPESPEAAGLPPGMGDMLGNLFGGGAAGGGGGNPLGGMLKQMGTAMFGSQVGQALASLAGEVVSGSDIGLPLGPEGKAVLLPANVDAFAEGLEIDIEQVRLYLALREAAYQRLFSHVPWLKPRLLGAVEEYARGITVDASKFSELAQQAEQMDLSNLDPSQLENMLGGGGLFAPVDTPAQKTALARLETLLALAEGWVDAVVHAAAAPQMSAADALRETLRRRRAAGGPAEQTFSALVGLELRPRRLRDASRLWASLTDARGLEGRDAVWSHPDLLPTSADLDDPDGFVHGRGSDSEDGLEFDFSGLDELLGGGAVDKSEDKGGEDKPAEGKSGESGETGQGGQSGGKTGDKTEGPDEGGEDQPKK
ncbi:zinc-dependent metalloprotease [Catenulispora sp. NL8]|uniref:Zinc-dependent metalloprotease n=1 Tax=Catenulispora pinistramenti TaxID=2705254 RepID=A0ABS5KIA3_9ACTN|nr:zinc-dependent metalloprotease [Catenulispora pinistramenti]MBS2545797.1 zinc-dependent metalloprotease [Catenulispora pinistramenti]